MRGGTLVPVDVKEGKEGAVYFYDLREYVDEFLAKAGPNSGGRPVTHLPILLHLEDRHGRSDGRIPTEVTWLRYEIMEEPILHLQSNAYGVRADLLDQENRKLEVDFNVLDLRNIDAGRYVLRLERSGPEIPRWAAGDGLTWSSYKPNLPDMATIEIYPPFAGQTHLPYSRTDIDILSDPEDLEESQEVISPSPWVGRYIDPPVVHVSDAKDSFLHGTIRFKDPRLLDAVRLELNYPKGTELFGSDLAKLKRLDLGLLGRNKGEKLSQLLPNGLDLSGEPLDLTGLDYATNLRDLNLAGHQKVYGIDLLSPKPEDFSRGGYSGLPRLESLVLDFCGKEVLTEFNRLLQSNSESFRNLEFASADFAEGNESFVGAIARHFPDCATSALTSTENQYWYVEHFDWEYPEDLKRKQLWYVDSESRVRDTSGFLKFSLRESFPGYAGSYPEKYYYYVWGREENPYSDIFYLDGVASNIRIPAFLTADLEEYQIHYGILYSRRLEDDLGIGEWDEFVSEEFTWGNLEKGQGNKWQRIDQFALKKSGVIYNSDYPLEVEVYNRVNYLLVTNQEEEIPAGEILMQTRSETEALPNLNIGSSWQLDFLTVKRTKLP